jgi:outer membrane receptor protein involved in Fe transport
LTLPWRGATIETGLKFTQFDNNSDVRYYNLVQGDYKIDSSKSNLFDYNEKNLAGYISGQKDFNKKWSGKAGLRYEYTITDGYSPTNGERDKSQYGKLFPSVYLSYKHNAANTVSLSYSKRINRPNFSALNPFRWYINPYSYYTGNPLLQPSYNNNIELAYLYKSVLSVTLYGQKLINGYGSIVEMINANKVVSRKNYLTQYNTGIETTLGLKFFPWWENRDFMSLNFTHASSSIPEVLPRQGFGVYYSMYNTFTLSKAVNVFLNFWHSLPANDGNVYSGSRYSLSSGVKISLADGRFLVNASVDDIARGTVSRGKIYFQDFTQYYSNYYDSRRLNVTGTYTFGKAKVKGSRKQVNFKETQRAN